jgi:murein DD-endopeptidase / murein LD-carboxypeptidase
VKKSVIFLAFGFCFLSIFGQNSLDENYFEKVNELLDVSKGKLECKYVWGEQGPNVFDCSGFTQYLFKQINIDIPRTAREQYYYFKGQIVSTPNIRKGDLVFFISEENDIKIGHVGLAFTDYSNGDFQFIHACSSKGVCISNYSDQFYKYAYAGARRIIKFNENLRQFSIIDTVNKTDVVNIIDTVILSEEPLMVNQTVIEFPNEYFYYTLKGNEDLLYVSRRYMVSVDNIRKWNGIKSNSLRGYKRLKIYLSIF